MRAFWPVHLVEYGISPNVCSYLQLTKPQLLAYALSNMAGIGGYNGWRWIFIIEGLITIVVAGVSKFFIVDWPENSKFLNDDERNILIRRLQEEVSEAKMNHLDKKAARRVFRDWKIYVGYVSESQSQHPT